VVLPPRGGRRRRLAAFCGRGPAWHVQLWRGGTRAPDDESCGLQGEAGRFPPENDGGTTGKEAGEETGEEGVQGATPTGEAQV
jgi:hypothetical protein